MIIGETLKILSAFEKRYVANYDSSRYDYDKITVSEETSVVII